MTTPQSGDQPGMLRGYRTTFTGLFDGAADMSCVEIPMIQRDYAQGRGDGNVPDIRSAFVDVLLDAVAGGGPVSLDFVYGRLDDGTLRPLDGQQRLTTLFLLHWYVASAAGQLEEDIWRRFSYATRPTARLFCERLAACALPPDVGHPSEWIRDQAWYQYGWRHDPTIRSMLTMIDAIHAAFSSAAFAARYPGYTMPEGWRRLTDPTDPAISFYVLPLPDLLADEELYIKMNSRGRPLTPLENLKAVLIADLAHSGRAGEFGRRMDGPWTDVFWQFDDGDDSIDAEMQRYLDFVTTVCEYREGRAPDGGLRARVREVFGEQNPQAGENIAFLFDAFDAWTSAAAADELFGQLFGTPDDDDDPLPLVLFTVDDSDEAGGNLLRRCLYAFDGTVRQGGRFRLQHVLLLSAVLRHLIESTGGFDRRLRVLRNLIAASPDQIRRERMAELLADVDSLVRIGDLSAVNAFSPGQVADEQAKAELLAEHPKLAGSIYLLEDHNLLRGTLTCIDPDPSRFDSRARAFLELFSSEERFAAVAGALLTVGDYMRRRGSTSWQFGAPANGPDDRGWRFLFTPGVRDDPQPTRRVLALLADGYVESALPAAQFLSDTMERFCADREHGQCFDWRYYVVRYDIMRSGRSGIYLSPVEHLGYELVMMDYKALNSYYRDPFLTAIWQAVGDERIGEPWFRGYLASPRWMRFTRSALRMGSVPNGFEIALPGAARHRRAFESLQEELSDMAFEPVRADSEETTDTADRLLLRIPQRETADGAIDIVDRVAFGARFARAALDARL